MIRAFKDELSAPQKKNQTVNIIVNKILSDGDEIFEINEKALKHFINDFIENNSRADFSHVEDKVRTEYSEKF